MLIDEGKIDGDYFNADDLDRIEIAISQSSPAGMIVMTMNEACPTGWLFVQGQVVANAQSLYPQWWAVMKASWKVGTDAHLPNMDQRFPMGAGTVAVGEVGGANSRVIGTTHLPPHVHDISHDHGVVTSEGYSHDHEHWLDGVQTETESALHAHVQYVSSDVVGGPATRVDFTRDAPGGGAAVYPQNIGTGTESVTHYHVISNKYTHGQTDDHTHNVNLPPFAANSGNGPGASTALDTTPSYAAVYFMVRVY